MILKEMLKKLYFSVVSLGNYLSMILEVVRVCFKKSPSWYLVRDQLYSVGVGSLPVVAIAGFSTGIVLAAQSFFQLTDKGLAGATGIMVTKSMIVELGPILTAFMVTGRIGSAMCAELGTMRVTEQIDALKSMAVNPLRYLVAPRLIAGIIVMPLLTIFSAFMGVVGGYMIAVHFYSMTPGTFLDPLPVHIHYFDFVVGLTKAFVFGIFIVTISCYQGLRASGGAAGVGKFTTHSVVVCYSVILFVNFLLTLGLNSSYSYLAEIIDGWM